MYLTNDNPSKTGDLALALAGLDVGAVIKWTKGTAEKVDWTPGDNTENK
jgi:hypothetical protein